MIGRVGEAARWRGALAYYGFVIILSAHFTIAYICGTRSYVDLAAYADGSFRTPFQYRALASWLMRMMIDCSLVQTLSRHAPAPFSDAATLAWLIITFAAMIVIIETSRRCIKIFVDDDFISKSFAFFSILSIYITHVALASIYRYSYPYDIVSLMLFDICVLTILSRKILWFYLFFVLATLSRETSIFLIPVLLCSNLARGGRSGMKLAIAHGAGLTILWLALKFWLYQRYGTNLTEADFLSRSGEKLGASHFVLQIGINLENLANRIYWPCIASALGWLWFPVAIGWKRLDVALLKAVILTLVPLFMIGMIAVGRITEPRIFSELSIFFVMALAVIARNRLQPSNETL